MEGEGRGGLLVFRRRGYSALTEFGALPGATGAVSPFRAPPSSVRAVDAMAKAPAGPPRKSSSGSEYLQRYRVLLAGPCTAVVMYM